MSSFQYCRLARSSQLGKEEEEREENQERKNRNTTHRNAFQELQTGHILLVRRHWRGWRDHFSHGEGGFLNCKPRDLSEMENIFSEFCHDGILN